MKRLTTQDQSWRQHAVEALARGELVIFPTETCYGIGVDATNEEAVQRLLEYKGGRGRKPISVAVADKMMASTYVEINSLAEHIYQEFLPGPVTVISFSKGLVAPQLVSERKTLGIRMPAYPLTLKLIEAFGKPITATSANTSNKKPPYSFQEWQHYTTKSKQALVGVYIDNGKLPVRPPSTIVDTTLNEPTILRQGELSMEDVSRATVHISTSEADTIALGQTLARHWQEKLGEQALVVALQGELGAGKTQLTKGIAQGLGIQEIVTSPTYLIMKEYEVTAPKPSLLIHIDTWRLSQDEGIEELLPVTKLTPGTVVVIEWMQKIRHLLDQFKNRAQIVYILIEGDGDDRRTIRVIEPEG